MAGEQQRDELVADLLVAEPVGALGRGAQQAAEDVGAISDAVLPALGDRSVHELIQVGAGRSHVRPRRPRTAQQPAIEVDPVELQGALEVSGDRRPAIVGVGVDAEERAQRYAQRCLTRPAVHVDGLTGRPGHAAGVGLRGHDRDRGIDLTAVERRHDQPPRAIVICLIGCDQAVTEQWRQLTEVPLSPMKLLGVLEQHVCGRGRAYEEGHAMVKHARLEHRPVTTVQLQQDPQQLLGAHIQGAPQIDREVSRRPATAQRAHLLANILDEELPRSEAPQHGTRDGRNGLDTSAHSGSCGCLDHRLLDSAAAGLSRSPRMARGERIHADRIRRAIARFQLVFCDHPRIAKIARRQPRQARSLAMVERILDAATRVLEDVGYHGASTNRIAAEAGVSPGSVYQYFTDKDEIVATIIKRLIDDFAEGVAPALRHAATRDPASGVRTVLESVLDVLEQNAVLLRALIDRVPAADQAEALRPVRARISDFIYQTLVTLNHTPPHEDDLDRLTWTILELTQHLPVRYVLDRPPIARADFVEDLSRIVLNVAYPQAIDQSQGDA